MRRAKLSADVCRYESEPYEIGWETRTQERRVKRGAPAERVGRSAKETSEASAGEGVSKRQHVRAHGL